MLTMFSVNMCYSKMSYYLFKEYVQFFKKLCDITWFGTEALYEMRNMFQTK